MQYLYFSLDVRVTVNVVAKNASGNKKKTRRTVGNNSTWQAIGNNSTQRGKNNIQRPIGNTRHEIGNNNTRWAIGKKAFSNRTTKYPHKQQQ